MMGLRKPQWFVKFEVAGFIYYGNISEFVFKNSDKPKWGNPLFWGKLTLPLDSQTRCFLFNVQLLWSYDYSNWVIFTKNRILHWKILNFGSLWSGGWKFLHQTTKRHTVTPNLVEQIVWHMWQWRCFDTRERRKKVRENRHGKLDVLYNTTSLARRCD